MEAPEAKSLSTDQAETESQSRDLRKRLVVRIAVAGVLLIGALVGFQWMADSPERVSQEPVVARPEAELPRAAPVAASTPSLAPVTAAAAPLEPVSTAPAIVAVDGTRPEQVAPLEPKSVPEVSAASRSKIPRGPHLQAGVFMEAVNAEELRAKLEAQGLPVYIESRVQVGPFKDRKEAERMRDELKAKGMTTLLIAK